MLFWAKALHITCAHPNLQLKTKAPRLTIVRSSPKGPPLVCCFGGRWHVNALGPSKPPNGNGTLFDTRGTGFRSVSLSRGFENVFFFLRGSGQLRAYRHDAGTGARWLCVPWLKACAHQKVRPWPEMSGRNWRALVPVEAGRARTCGFSEKAPRMFETWLRVWHVGMWVSLAVLCGHQAQRPDSVALSKKLRTMAECSCGPLR